METFLDPDEGARYGDPDDSRKADLKPFEFREVVDSMRRLNKYATEIMKRYPVNSRTDVTGFGLIGHVYEMAYGSGRIDPVGNRVNSYAA